MEQGDIIRITDVQTLDGYSREMLNVYYFQVVTITSEVPLPVYGEDLQAAFNAHIIARVKAVQSTALKHIRVDMLNMTNLNEEYSHTWTTPIAGVTPGDYGPGNLTYSFRLQRYDRITRNGRKSIPGVPESAHYAGRLLAPDYLTDISALSAVLGTFMTVEGDSVDATLNPVIVRVPANPGVPVTQFSPVVQAAFRGFGTQNSRKEL